MLSIGTPASERHIVLRKRWLQHGQASSKGSWVDPAAHHGLPILTAVPYFCCSCGVALQRGYLHAVGGRAGMAEGRGARRKAAASKCAQLTPAALQRCG